MPIDTMQQREPKPRDVIFVVVMLVILGITISMWDTPESTEQVPDDTPVSEMVPVGRFHRGAEDQEVPLTTSADTVMGPTQRDCWMEFIYHSTQRAEIATAFAFGHKGCMVQVSYQLDSQLCTGFSDWSMPELSATATFYRAPFEDEATLGPEPNPRPPACDAQGLEAVAFRLGVPAAYGTDPMEVKITDGFVLLRSAPA
ncbi:MAG: hypothetical protein QG675_351 [Patescibacteria group bacterium]|jgi:hypothetical protein|nr:hypothetical protein [Patescibacteria group bacterium]